MAKHKSLPYRPALDGLRGLAVGAVVLFHVWPDGLRGGWLGVDLFFVLSGFLITSLLLTEHRRWGRISLAGFWAARARRLLPSLAVVLAAVIVCSMLFAQPGRRGAIAGDVIAAMGYVANWRFLLGDEQYFAAIAMPSPVRHAWSLSIEEQYYILFPLLLSALLVFVRRRTTLAMVFGGLALVSAWWMAHLYLPGVEPSRVYYGTDTRIFELLVGSAAGALLGTHEFAERSRWRIDHYLGRLAWPAIALFVAACLFLNEDDSIVFQGGLLALCLILVIPIAAAASREPSTFKRAFSWEPLRQTGLLSYSLYLWHWPVVVFLTTDRVGLPKVALAIVQVAVSVGLAWLSMVFIERPIRRGGFRALIPERPALSSALAWCTVPVLALGLFTLPHVKSVAGTQQNGSDITLEAPDYVPAADQTSVALLGNSIPSSVVSAFDISAYPDLLVNSVVNYGCDPWNAAKIQGGKPVQPSESCAQWRNQWPAQLRNDKAKLTVWFAPQSLVSDWQVDGKRLEFGSPEFVNWIERTLDGLRQTTRSAGSPKFAVMTLACHRVPSVAGQEAGLINNDSRVQKLNTIIKNWATKNNAPVIDQYAALCTGGYHQSINGVQLYEDTIHFSRESGRIFWTLAGASDPEGDPWLNA